MGTYQELFSVFFLPIVLVAVMYFVIILPQKKREKKIREMISKLQVNNEVTTIGGLIGKVINIKDDEVIIESSIEKTQIKLKKWAIKEVETRLEA